VGEELRYHSSSRDLEQAAKHYEACERLFNRAAEISYPIFWPVLTSSTKACTVCMIAHRPQSHVRFLFRFYDDSRDLSHLSVWERVQAVAQHAVAFICLGKRRCLARIGLAAAESWARTDFANAHQNGHDWIYKQFCEGLTVAGILCQQSPHL
jgi:hypothetical protein